MTDARMAALEAVAEAARRWDEIDQPGVSYEEAGIRTRALEAAIRALPAPAQAQGEAAECWEHESGSINFLRAGSSDAATLAKTKYWRRRGTVTLPIRVEGGGE